ncbi:cytochrome c oxidase assembly protein [Acidiferrimicrobium sp. IK]|uniref:cytochrome c oxidase assembly protein n=1 Tax=Acidiferrimicrobium sp. IK TaxID=2871700 RepID=UPI0021CB4709|nr:cytochrome c oxidase assembly protein [Acidiferrimicrobium sp. IK]MCU4186685.1 cytochrome c oxidase assembly protein [Acidiferrimicrobium sp. IK]
MSLLTSHWTLDPFLAVTVLVAAWHEHGVRHLASRSRPARNAGRRRQSLLFYAGLTLLDLAVMSPIDYWSDQFFWVHQVQHLLLMFAAPVLIVAGAPWLPLAHGLPVRQRRRVGRALLLSGWSAPLRQVARTLTRPWVAVVVFNLDMVAWHLPVLFDLAYRNPFVHIWLMHGLFFVTGVAFWLQFTNSYPLRPRLTPIAQIGALFGTNVVMFVIAMTLGLLATTAWYPVYANLHTGLSAVGDQHLGAGILWVCGDFWALPAMHRAMRRFIDDDRGATWESRIDRLLQGAR